MFAFLTCEPNPPVHDRLAGLAQSLQVARTGVHRRIVGHRTGRVAWFATTEAIDASWQAGTFPTSVAADEKGPRLRAVEERGVAIAERI